ncbi:MAG: hypothetical protein MMC33_005042 [Icmadophila ericetorum]|nr:hypothetical protein [Icmadophila ericetorum]
MSFGFGFGDFTAVSTLATTIRKRFVNAPEEFRAISDEQVMARRVEPNIILPGSSGSRQDISNSYHDADVRVAFIYCNYQRQEEQKPVVLLASLLKQLVQEQRALPREVKSLYKQHFDKRTQPSVEETLAVLRTVTASYKTVFTVIDALDKYRTHERQQLLSEVFNLQIQANVNVFATSPILPDITSQFKGMMSREIRASEVDVRRYLENHMSQLPTCVSKNSTLQNEITTEIIKAVHGMFLLAQLHMDSLRHKTTTKAVKLALKNLP